MAGLKRERKKRRNLRRKKLKENPELAFLVKKEKSEVFLLEKKFCKIYQKLNKINEKKDHRRLERQLSRIGFSYQKFIQLCDSFEIEFGNKIQQLKMQWERIQHLRKANEVEFYLGNVGANIKNLEAMCNFAESILYFWKNFNRRLKPIRVEIEQALKLR